MRIWKKMWKNVNKKQEIMRLNSAKSTTHKKTNKVVGNPCS